MQNTSATNWFQLSRVALGTGALTGIQSSISPLDESLFQELNQGFTSLDKKNKNKKKHTHTTPAFKGSVSSL